MTYNEAIGILAIVVETAKGRCFVTDEAISDAYDMAISALKAQPAKTQLSREDTTLGVKKTCITCKHYPPESKWPCIDCDMRNVDRWEAQEAKHSTELSLIQKTLDTVSRQEVIDEIRKCRFVVDAIEKIRGLPPAQPQWIPISESLPEEDHWLGGSGKQFSDNVLISILNSDDEDEWVDVSYTIDGEWTLELPRYCKITAWKPLPEPYGGGR